MTYGTTSLFIFLSNVFYFLLAAKKLQQSSHKLCHDQVNLKQIIKAKKESRLEWAMADRSSRRLPWRMFTGVYSGTGICRPVNTLPASRLTNSVISIFKLNTFNVGVMLKLKLNFSNLTFHSLLQLTRQPTCLHVIKFCLLSNFVHFTQLCCYALLKTALESNNTFFKFSTFALPLQHLVTCI